MDYKDLSEEGKRMFDNLSAYSDLVKPKSGTIVVEQTPPPRPPRITKDQRELYDLKMELAKMINNSQMVIRDCDAILAKCETLEDYIKTDAKVAKTLHLNLINRLTRVMSGMPAFEDESHLTLDVTNMEEQMRTLRTS